MATKDEIREWLEACGARDVTYVVWKPESGQLHITQGHIDNVIRQLSSFYINPSHLINPELTGVQGPTFAEWKKQKGREGKILKIMDAYNEDSLYGHMGPAMAAKILDAIEGGE